MAGLLYIFVVASEIVDIGKNTQCRSSILLIAQRNNARLAFFLDPSLAGRLALELGNNTCG